MLGIFYSILRFHNPLLGYGNFTGFLDFHIKRIRWAGTVVQPVGHLACTC